MKMKKEIILGLSIMALVMTACQAGNGFKVKGVAEGFNDGDTLFFAEEVGGQPKDTIIVSGGKFTMEGETDSVKLCCIQSVDGTTGALFFNEPGTIKVTIAKDKPATVGGTKANDGWQELNDLQTKYNEELSGLVVELYNENTTEERKDELLAKYNTLQQSIMDGVMETCEKNIGNELGFFIVTSLLKGEEVDAEKIYSLIEKMPAQYRQRKEIANVEKKLDAQRKVAIGKTIEDFTMPTPDGGEMNVMSEVKKNKLTILDFWASWCGPCRREMPFMVELYNKYREQGLGIVGISFDNDHDEWTKAIAEMGMPWPQMSDLKDWDSAAAEMFQVKGIPYMVVVDQKGEIVMKNLRGDDLELYISEQLKKQ